MLLPEEERGSFVKALMRDHDALIKAVCKVDVERARAFDPADQHNIFEAVRATCGVHALNVAAAGGLRDALAQAGMQVLESTTGLVACDLANQLGWLFKELGKYDEARRLLERALEGRERELGPDHVDTLAALGNLAVVAALQGKHKEARRLQERALVGMERTFGPDHEQTLSSMNNLAGVFVSQGKYWRAQRLYERALAGKESTLGPDHVSTLRTVNNLANVYADTLRWKRAGALYARALDGKERAVGPDHPTTLTALQSLGAFHAGQLHLRTAAQYFEKALDGKAKALGWRHPETVNSMTSLAQLLWWTGQRKKRRQLHERAGLGEPPLLPRGLAYYRAKHPC